MALKLSVKPDAITALNAEFNAIDPAMEGFWQTIKDKVAYMFTKDEHVSEKIGNMIYWLNHMDSDQIRELESTPIDRKFQTYDNMKKIMAFSAEAVDFCLKNLVRYEGTSYVISDEARKKISDEMEGVCNQFEASHDRNEIAAIIEGQGATKGQKTVTLISIGFTKNHIEEIAKTYKAEQAGRLSKLNKMKFIANMTGHEVKNTELTVAHMAARNFGVILKDAVRSYKFVNEFLFYMYRLMQRQKIILH